MDRAAFFVYLIILVSSPLLFGSVHTYAYTYIFCLILAGQILLLVDSLKKDLLSGKRVFKWPVTAFNPLFFVLLIYLLMQIIPLPAAVVGFFSPGTKRIAEQSLPAALAVNQHPPSAVLPLASYVYPVRMSLLRWFMYGMFFLGLIRTLSSRGRIETATGCILAVAGFSSLYGIFQTYAGSNHIWWFTKTAYLEDVTGTFINRNNFAFFMGAALILAVSYSCSFTRIGLGRKGGFRRRFSEFLVSQQFLGKRMLARSSGMVIGLGLILSASRAGIMAAAGGLFSLSLFFLMKKSQRRNGLIVLSIFLLILLLAIFIGTEHTWERFHDLDASFTIRQRYTETTLHLFRAFMSFGVGVGNFRFAYPRYQSGLDNYVAIKYAHNDWVQFLAEAGIIGFVLLLAGIVYYLYRFVSAVRREDGPYRVALGIMPLAAAVMIGIHSWFDFNLHIPANFLIMSAIVAIGERALTIEQNPAAKSPAPCHPRSLKGIGGVFLGLYVFALLAAGWWSVSHFMAETYCNTVNNSTFNRDKSPSADRILKAIAWQDSNAAYWYKLARNLMSKRRRDGDRAEDPEIIKALEQAIRLNPFVAAYHLRLGHEYLDRAVSPGGAILQKYLRAADLCMERAAYFIGDRNPWQHKELGDYWLVRAVSFSGGAGERRDAPVRAEARYKHALLIESDFGKKRLYQDIRKTVNRHLGDLESAQDTGQTVLRENIKRFLQDLAPLAEGRRAAQRSAGNR